MKRRSFLASLAALCASPALATVITRSSYTTTQILSNAPSGRYQLADVYANAGLPPIIVLRDSGGRVWVRTNVSPLTWQSWDSYSGAEKYSGAIWIPEVVS